MTRPPSPEFSRPVAVDRLDADGSDVDAAATEAERVALARRFGLVAVDAVRITGRLIPEDADGAAVRLEARVVADVIQSCVVTLEPVAAHIDAAIERLYSAAVADEWGPDNESRREIVLGEDEGTVVEPLIGGTIDIGEAAAEQLALELDPFPRAPGSRFEGFASPDGAAAAEKSAEGPFAALAALRRGPPENG